MRAIPQRWRGGHGLWLWLWDGWRFRRGGLRLRGAWRSRSASRSRLTPRRGSQHPGAPLVVGERLALAHSPIASRSALTSGPPGGR